MQSRLAVALCVVAMTGCGGGDGTGLTLSPRACVYDGPRNVDAGQFAVTLRNETSQPARFALFEVRGSSGYGALAKHVREEQQRLERGETALGPPTFAVLRRRIAVSPRKNGELALELRQGTFALVCANGPDPGTALFLAGRLEVER